MVESSLKSFLEGKVKSLWIGLFIPLFSLVAQLCPTLLQPHAL